jgi:hypothetical protein
MRKGRVAKEARQAAAKERQARRDGRTDEQQHRKLINEGHGHCKEVAKLRERMTQRVTEVSDADV